MALRDDILPVINNARQLMQDLGFRQSRVFIRIGRWTPATGAAEVGKGALANTDTEILPRPRVENMGMDRLRVSRITPSFNDGVTSGGYDGSELLPDQIDGENAHIIVTNDEGVTRPYAVVDIETEPKESSFGYTLMLEPLDRAGPHY